MGNRLLLHVLDEGYARGWYGTALRTALRGVTPQHAVWRPARRRHNIWEIIVHAAYWKYRVRQRLTGGASGEFPYGGTNWFRRDTADAAAWRADLALLEQQHQRLRDAVAALPARTLQRKLPKGATAEQNILGIAMHDVYHAAQIQLLKPLRRNGAS